MSNEKLSEMREDEKKSSSESVRSLKKVSSKLAIVDDGVDFGGEKSLPPPPQLTPEEEKRLYRKIDLRYVMKEFGDFEGSSSCSG